MNPFRASNRSDRPGGASDRCAHGPKPRPARLSTAGAPRRLGRRAPGFILLEAMMATAIFAIAVLALARCIESGIQSGVILKEDARAQRALVNWMRELEAGAQPYSDGLSVELKREFTGMRMRQSVTPLELVDQNKNVVDGILEVNLELSWLNGGGMKAVKQLKFYAYPTGG
jgi:type II secretory pathway pseudopilin PulG